MLRPNSGIKRTRHAEPFDSEPAEQSAATASQTIPVGAKRERNAAATRQRILDAGEREFAARGFAGARLREIADSAGVQPALIHHYFTDKHGLYRAVLDRALLPSSTESWTLLESGLELEELISGLIEVLLRFYAAHHNLLAILRHEALSGSSVLEELARERMLPIIEAVSRLLEERQRAGELRADIPAAEIIAAGMGLVAFPFVEEGLIRVMLPSIEARDEAALVRRKDAILKILSAAIRPPPVESATRPPPPLPSRSRAKNKRSPR